ncbi:hypothetical protein BJX76DRAFT_343227 [Aspergillus varians]
MEWEGCICGMHACPVLCAGGLSFLFLFPVCLILLPFISCIMKGLNMDSCQTCYTEILGLGC